ncbi:MAG: serine protease [Polyangiaceae bacterium]
MQSGTESAQSSTSSAVVYGSDDRRDYYDVQDGPLRKMFAYSVVLIPDYRIQSLLDGTLTGIHTWGELEQLCPGEPFAEQPSAAFCSGVLVGQGMILTSRHCVAETELASTRVALGYYLDGVGHLALDMQDVHELTSVVSSSDQNSDGIDYAWLRFAGETTQILPTAPVITSPSPVGDGEPLLSVNSGGGIPLKLDAGGTVVDARHAIQDYFLADIDAFRGASGSGVFNSDGALVGVLTGGNADFVRTDSGCRKTIRLSNTEANERIMYVRQAIDGLCTVEPGHSLCDRNCEQPCYDRFTPSEHANAACSLRYIKRGNSGAEWGMFEASALVAVAALRRRMRGRCCV